MCNQYINNRQDSVEFGEKVIRNLQRLRYRAIFKFHVRFIIRTNVDGAQTSLHGLVKHFYCARESYDPLTDSKLPC